MDDGIAEDREIPDESHFSKPTTIRMDRADPKQILITSSADL